MELDSYSQVLMRLLSIVQFAIILLEESDASSLFPKDEKIDEGVMADFEKINRECFYGRSFGFQVCYRFEIFVRKYLFFLNTTVTKKISDNHFQNSHFYGYIIIIEMAVFKNVFDNL